MEGIGLGWPMGATSEPWPDARSRLAARKKSPPSAVGCDNDGGQSRGTAPRRPPVLASRVSSGFLLGDYRLETTFAMPKGE
jgi:hypothetical protein